MLVLVLIACLESRPCAHVQLSPEVPLATCIARSQIEAARWIGGHPKYQVRKIKCMTLRELAYAISRFRA
jgi:hypothetical protein